MNVFGFVLMGVGIVVLYIKIPLNIVSKILVLTFGACMITVGFFQHEPVAGYGLNNVMESNIHSIIANVMGIAITLFAVSLIFDKNARIKYRVIALLAALISSFLSFTLAVLPNYYGITQRIMFMLILGWLFYAAIGYQKKLVSRKYRERVVV
jgi:hypothetical protein